MLIVLEGCDGVGKTTLARRLAQRIQDRTGDAVDLVHRGPPARHPLEEYELDLDWYLMDPEYHDVGQAGSPHVVADRWHWGEPIYGELYRGESLLGGDDGPGMRHVDLYLRSRGALVVHVEWTGTPEALAGRLKTEGEDYLKTEHVAHVLDRYREVCRHRLLPVAHVSPLDPAEPLDLDRLIGQAALLEQVARDVHVNQPRYVGSPLPELLLVGEETSPRHLRGERPPFLAPFVPYRDSCGWWLLTALPAEALPGVGLVNARETEDLHALWELLGEPTVVALGKTADVALDASGVPHGTVPHPQYVRRFHHARLADYGDLILHAARTEERTYSWSR